MLRLFSAILDWLQSLLGIFSPPTVEEDEDKPAADEKRPPIYIVRKLTKKAQTSLKEEAPPKLGDFSKSFIFSRRPHLPLG